MHDLKFKHCFTSYPCQQSHHSKLINRPCLPKVFWLRNFQTPHNLFLAFVLENDRNHTAVIKTNTMWTNVAAPSKDRSSYYCNTYRCDGFNLSSPTRIEFIAATLGQIIEAIFLDLPVAIRITTKPWCIRVSRLHIIP